MATSGDRDMAIDTRKRRRRAVSVGLCPKCGVREIAHVVPYRGREAVSCEECWPDLLESLQRDGAIVSGCVGPCCSDWRVL